MKLWEKLDNLIKEQRKVEKSMQRRIVVGKRESKKDIWVWINDDPILNIGCKYEGMFDDRPILHTEFSCDVKHAEKLAQTILKLLDAEDETQPVKTMRGRGRPIEYNDEKHKKARENYAKKKGINT